MTPGLEREGGGLAVDVKISVPELSDISSFWIRSFPTHYTFAELYQECINHPAVLQSGRSLERIRASRHFWHGHRMMLRGEPRDLVADGAEGSSGEISLVLRRDYYQVGPSQYIAGGVEYTYVNSEAAIDEVLAHILNPEEKLCCFDLCDSRGKRLDREQSLANYALWPAWEDAPAEEFPDHARLLIRPRTSWLPYAILVVGALIGAILGYWLITVLLTRGVR